MTKTEVEKQLSSPNIERRIEQIINNVGSQPLSDMIIFAEYLEQKHKRGFVVYWTTAGIPRFEVSNYIEYIECCHYKWVGETQWHTSMCDE